MLAGDFSGFSQSYLCLAQGRRELRKSGGARSPILPHFLENSLFIAFLCDNFLGFQKSGGAAAPTDPPVTTPLIRSASHSLTVIFLTFTQPSRISKIYKIHITSLERFHYLPNFFLQTKFKDLFVVKIGLNI